MIVWISHFALDFNFVSTIQKIIDFIFLVHLKLSRDDEQFEISKKIIERLQNYAFSQNFVVVTSFCDFKNNFRKYYHCIHHSIEIQNNRKLNEHKNTIENSINRRRELIHIRVLNCKWRLFINYKRIDRKFKESKIWMFCVQKNQLKHFHFLQTNSFLYEIHRLWSFDYNKILQIVKIHRSIFIYEQFDRVLINIEQNFDEMLHIDRKKYYNFIFSIIRNQRDIILKLLIVLKKFDDMIIRTRYEYERDVNDVFIKRILKQISWMNNQQKKWIKRFCSNFFIEFDVIFNINVLKMLLFVNIEITNINMIFFVIFSFVLIEFEMTTTIFLIFLKNEMWIQNTNFSRVIIIDQNKSMLTSLNVVMFKIYRQFCQFHACENIKIKYVVFFSIFFFTFSQCCVQISFNFSLTNWQQSDKREKIY